MRKTRYKKGKITLNGFLSFLGTLGISEDVFSHILVAIILILLTVILAFFNSSLHCFMAAAPPSPLLQEDYFSIIFNIGRFVICFSVVIVASFGALLCMWGYYLVYLRSKKPF